MLNHLNFCLLLLLQINALREEDLSENFFKALAHVHEIHANCKVLLRTHHQVHHHHLVFLIILDTFIALTRACTKSLNVEFCYIWWCVERYHCTNMFGKLYCRTACKMIGYLILFIYFFWRREDIFYSLYIFLLHQFFCKNNRIMMQYFIS